MLEGSMSGFNMSGVNEENMKQCKKCLLPEKADGAFLNSKGICNYCTDYTTEKQKNYELERNSRLVNFENAIKYCRNKSEYDCLVPFSGGKDSVYLIYKLKYEYKLRILAYTTNANIPDLAWKNIYSTLKKLDVEHISFTPSHHFYKKLFNHLFLEIRKSAVRSTRFHMFTPPSSKVMPSAWPSKSRFLWFLRATLPVSPTLSACSTSFHINFFVNRIGPRLR